MSKFVRRPTVGIALGGGGARGLAHIGVLEVFEREGIPIDCMSGTSMGGIIAALYAAGLSPAELSEIAISLANPKNFLRFLDLTPPQHGIIKTEKIQAYLSELIGKDTTFADLRFPISLTSVDLITKKIIYLTEGSVVEACMATSAVPGLFPPVEKDGMRLVDGGVLDNVPAQAARKMGAEYVIAVDVNYFVGSESNWVDFPKDATIRRFLPAFALDFYLAEIIMSSAITAQNLKKANPQIILNPSVPADVNIFFGFTKAAETIQHGRNAAQTIISRVKDEIKPKLHLFPANIDPKRFAD
ncbi:MAG: patatin-like phospholipase family protein [Anaerolineales bacterium]